MSLNQYVKSEISSSSVKLVFIQTCLHYKNGYSRGKQSCSSGLADAAVTQKTGSEERSAGICYLVI